MEKDTQIFFQNKRADNSSFQSRIRQIFWIEKLSNKTGLLILLFISLVFGTLIVFKGIVAGAFILLSIIVPAVIYGIVMYPLFGISILMVMAYFLFFIMKTGIDFPLGTAMDGIQGLLILGFFIHQKKKPDWDSLKGSISFMILLWIGYNFVEIVNPTAESRLAWVYTIRSVAIVMLMYFVFMYQIKTVKSIRIILKIWIFLSVLAALYAYKQEYFGFSDAEQAWLDSDPNIADLLYIAGHWRKFSIFSDPVAFSYNMVVSSILCICLITNTKKTWKKAVLIFFIFLLLTAMLFSGTRGAYVLLPAAMVLFLILRFSRQVLIGSAIAAVFIVFLIFVPTSDQNILRFQTAFKPSEDVSFKARTVNQKRIQPYIWSHPMGGGLGATGAWGQRFAPNSYLAHFPPDSGYVRVAVELGWIGLLLFCCLMFSIMRTGIDNYYTIRNKELKTYCMAVLLIIFAYNIGNYPQEALVQFPSNIYFYLAVALINVTKKIDDRIASSNEISF
ncbi:O-antigen ligase family protein [Dyadobacter frigoris]|uniref:O-antigen ligase family protein n=1 Tax=Dyadobacter frigoris TaxID=2576211 RepID=A0A4U6D251_9BACT|nr:O-antigen ligase family protein [Dyadobacter frigoris]TKT90227.1 O-antigen ligase family protein [Dyadobacter frigoris]GLU52462.1 hypothetical protein Dfri01_19230 [Dyadobacter frigoris]